MPTNINQKILTSVNQQYFTPINHNTQVHANTTTTKTTTTRVYIEGDKQPK